LCADDDQRSIIQLELEYNGVTIIGSGLRQIKYPNDVSGVDSLYVLRQSAYLAASGTAGGLYSCNLETLDVERLLRNSSDSRGCMVTGAASFSPTAKITRVKPLIP